MAQKIIKIGSSVGITLSKDLLRSKGMAVGDSVRVSPIPGEQKIVIELEENERTELNPELLSWADDFIEKNRELLKRLADK